MADTLDALERAEVVSTLDVELARTLGRIGGETRSEVLLAVALTQRAQRAGHSCLDLDSHADTLLASPEDAVESDVRAPSKADWLAALRSSPLLRPSPPWQLAPLVLEGEKRLYFARNHEHERAVAASLRALATRRFRTPALDTGLLDALFEAHANNAPDLQRAAVVGARERGLSVIVGGPGTGKTSTVVKLLALLVHDALTLGDPAPRIALVAPTGKAAQRLSESIGRARERLPVSEAVRAAIPSAAATIHRALGTREDGPPRYRHGPDLPLHCDVLLVDEASMIDLALMRHLLAAVPEHARVILLGDADQLASVEAGSVLDDICRADVAESPLQGCVQRLVHSYRYRADSGIARLARAIHAGSFEALCAARDARLPDAAISHEGHGKRGPAGLLALATDAYAGLSKPQPEERLACLDGFRVLTAHRRGVSSAEELNRHIAEALVGRRAFSNTAYAGRPIMIRANDYATQTFNGDVGVLYREPSDGALVAYFRGDDGELRKLAYARLPAHDSVYAMTIHKSQGSEFGHVAVVLPERASPMLSRELLYTAVTRARERVAIFASESALKACLSQRTTRASGLSELLAAPEVERRVP